MTADGPWRFADFFDGEVYDSRIDLQRLNWHSAVEEKLRVQPRLSVRYGEKVVAHEVLTPIAWMEAPSGELICDFGQNIAGVASFCLHGKAGQEIVIRHAEAIQNGELYVQNLRSAKQELRYISREGEQEYSPRFTYMGFRYVGIRGIAKEDLELKAIAVYSDLETIGAFRCSNEDLNQLQSNLTWSGKDNFVDIPTDCPQRDERQGWTGDIALFSPTACFNFDMSRFLEKWLRDLASEQTATGAIPFVVPARKGVTPTMTTSCWGDSSILVPWALYMANGDKGLLERQYPSMKKYLADVRRWASLSLPFYGSRYILKLPFQFGDWCAPYGALPDWLSKGPWIGTAYFYRSSLLMSRIAAILGKEEDSRRYAAQAEKIRSAFRKAFTDGKGRMKEEFQAAYVLALAFDLAQGEEKHVMAKRLWALVKEAGIHLNTGFTATPFLLFALCDNGFADEAYELLLQDSRPSWLYSVKRGATTIWEHWDSLREDGSIEESSLNHYAYGAVGDFLYRRISGLEAIEAGYRRFAVKPVPGGGLTWAECVHKCPYEEIKGSFDYWDPNLFEDEDGRLYFYWGCANATPIWGVELDRDTLRPIGERRELIWGDPYRHGYERFGDDHCENPRTESEIEALFQSHLRENGLTEDSLPAENRVMLRATFAGMPYIEGAWMTKHAGRYYLQYACPGAELNVYADGVYVSDSPLGPFTPAENNLYSYKPGGFLPGAGHGSTLRDRDGAWWHTATMRISVNHVFERRVGLWPAGFDKDGEIFCNQRYGDWPQDMDALRRDPWAEPKWMLLSFGKRAFASSHVEGKGPENAVDENVQTWWRPASAEKGQWLCVDLGDTMTVNAVQVNFADDPATEIPCPGALVPGPDMERYIDMAEMRTRWLLESSLDGITWAVFKDKREADTDLSHDLAVKQDGVEARFIRLTVEEVSYGVAPCVSGLRVFGKGKGEKPKAPEATVRRTSDLDFTVSVEPSDDVLGYNILWGHRPDKLYHSYLVMGKGIDNKRVGALIKDQSCYVRVDAFNENGITHGYVIELQTSMIAGACFQGKSGTYPNDEAG